MESEAQLLDTFAAGIWKFVVVAVEENRGEVVSSMFCDAFGLLWFQNANVNCEQR